MARLAAAFSLVTVGVPTHGRLTASADPGPKDTITGLQRELTAQRVLLQVLICVGVAAMPGLVKHGVTEVGLLSIVDSSYFCNLYQDVQGTQGGHHRNSRSGCQYIWMQDVMGSDQVCCKKCLCKSEASCQARFRFVQGLLLAPLSELAWMQHDAVGLVMQDKEGCILSFWLSKLARTHLHTAHAL